MRMPRMNGGWILAVALVSVAAIAKNAVAAPARPATTDVTVVVTGGQPARPIKGATVYLEWKERGATKSRQGTTNAQGFAGPYRIPRTKVFVQVTTNDDEWDSRGDSIDLKAATHTIKMNLPKTR